MTTTFFDIIILTIISTSTLLAVIYGLIDTALSTIAFFGTIIVAFLIFPFVEDILTIYIAHEILLNIVTGIVSYLLSIVLFMVIKSLCRKLAGPISGSMIDRILGLFFGLFRGVLIAGIFVLLLICITPTKSIDIKTLKNMDFTNEDKPEWLFNSYGFFYFSSAFKTLNTYFPTLYDNVYEMVIVQLDTIKNNHKAKTEQLHDSNESMNNEDKTEPSSGNGEKELDGLLENFLKEKNK